MIVTDFLLRLASLTCLLAIFSTGIDIKLSVIRFVEYPFRRRRRRGGRGRGGRPRRPAGASRRQSRRWPATWSGRVSAGSRGCGGPAATAATSAANNNRKHGRTEEGRDEERNGGERLQHLRVNCFVFHRLLPGLLISGPLAVVLSKVYCISQRLFV